MYNQKWRKDKIKKEKRYLYFFVLASIFSILACLMIIYQAFKIFRPLVSKAQKIEEIASIGIPQVVFDQVGICTGVVQPECQIIPVTYDRTIAINMNVINSIGGKWGGRNAQVQSTLPVLKVEPRKIKNWNSSISNSPYRKSNAIMEVEFEQMTDSTLHQVYNAWISMDVVYPSISASFQFRDVTKSYEYQKSFFTLSPLEYGKLKTVEIPRDDIYGVIFGILFFLAWGSVYIFCTKHQLKEVRKLSK